MSLGLSMQNALSGLKATQMALGVLSNNIANANNPDYSRQQVVQTSVSAGGLVGNGVQITDVTRVVDEFIAKTVVTRTSDVSYADTIKQYYSQAQLSFGNPGQNNSINSYVDSFFQKLQTLSVSGTESPASKQEAVSSAVELTQQISDLANSIEGVRFQADQGISSSIGKINDTILALKGINRAIINAASIGQSKNGLYDQMDAKLKDLGNEIDINYKISPDGTVVVNTKGGVSLLDGNAYQLQYKPASSVDNMVNNSAMSPIKIVALDNAGETIGTPFDIATDGVRDQVTTSIVGGKLKAFLDIRDNIMPKIVDQLNSLASNLKEEINKVHNDGVSFPPPSSLTGTTLIDPTASDNWSGKFMVAVLGADGAAPKSPYAKQQAGNVGFEPLTIDLSKLDSGSGAGKPSYQAIIDEINAHFGVPQTKVALGDIGNIELASKSDSLTAGSGTFNFDLELTNLSVNNTKFRVTGVTTSDAGIVVSNPASFPTPDYTSAAGEKARTGSAFSFGLNMAGAGAAPYTVTLAVESEAPDGTITSGTVSYTVPAVTAGMMNDRYPVKAGSSAGSAVEEAPLTMSKFLTASLVDENGVEVPKDPVTGSYTKSGYLKIQGANSSYRVALSELDSSHKGDPSGNPPVAATDRGFSHYAGLNNLFIDNANDKSPAVNLKVRADIVAAPQLMSVGSLTKARQSTNFGSLPNYTYEISNGSNQVATSLANLGIKGVSFSPAGGLPETTVSFSSYASDIISSFASKLTTAGQNYDQESSIYKGFADKDQNVKGVNIDEEMANTITYQNAYAANARVLTTTKELFQTLLDAF